MYRDARNVEYGEYDNTGTNFSHRRLRIQKLRLRGGLQI